MSRPEPVAVRLLSFGDPDGDTWGAAVSAGAACALVASGGVGQSARLTPQDDGWRLEGDAVSLTFTASGPCETGDTRGQVTGHIDTGGERQTVSCPATLTAAGDARLDRLDSLRALSGWFAEEHALSLRALRPTGGKGHEQDDVVATLFDPEACVAVADPRLSTTFRPDESPSRASLELWVGEEEELYPRRAAAEAIGPPAHAQTDGLRLSVTPLRCHSAGHDGAGVYLIARF